jgi:hypothetical protein
MLPRQHAYATRLLFKEQRDIDGGATRCAAMLRHDAAPDDRYADARARALARARCAAVFAAPFSLISFIIFTPRHTFFWLISLHFHFADARYFSPISLHYAISSR